MRSSRHERGHQGRRTAQRQLSGLISRCKWLMGIGSCRTLPPMSTNVLVPVPVDEPQAPQPRQRMPWEEVVAYSVIGAGVLFILMQHLVSAAVVGLALYLILDRVSARF